MRDAKVKMERGSSKSELLFQGEQFGRIFDQIIWSERKVLLQLQLVQTLLLSSFKMLTKQRSHGESF